MKENAKKIVVNYLGRKGGGPVYAFEMTRGLIQNGYDVTAIISDRIENFESWTKLSPITLEIIPTFDSDIDFFRATIGFLINKLPELKKKYKHKQVDAVYMPMQHPWMNHITKLFPEAKTIYTLHDPKEHRTNNGIKEKAKAILTGLDVSKMNDVVILSECFRDYVKQVYGLSDEQIHTIPHGIFDYYSEIEDGSVHTYPKDKQNLLFFGRIDAYKGLDVLASAYQMIKNKKDDIALTIVGSGDFEPYSEMFSPLKDVTIINEWIPDEKVASFFKNDKVILIAPYTDATQSGVIPIAMSSGVPVIASDAGGLKEQVEDGITGYLVKAGNASDLARIISVASDTDNTVIVKNAKQFIKSLSWNCLSEKLGEIVNG